MNRHGGSFVGVCGVVALGACAPQGELEADAPGSGWVERFGGGPRYIELTETWEPQSGDVIDCRGGSILPTVLPADNDGLSEPDTLIYLGSDVKGVRIENCTLDATFPIVALEGGSHRIFRNTIDSTARGVLLVGSSHNRVDHNTMTTSGRNVLIIGDSDGNLVWKNDLSFAAGRSAIDGSPGLTAPTDPQGVGVGTFSYPGVETLIVNDEVHQHLTYRDTHPEGTTVVSNRIHNEGGDLGIIFATRSSHARAYANTVTGGNLGMAVFGYTDDSWFVEPGTCSLDPSLSCVVYDGEPSFECALPGRTPAGECEGYEYLMGGGRVVAPKFMGNRVSGAFMGWSGGSSDGLTLERNDLSGNTYGIELWGYALERGTIRGNVTSGNEVGLEIDPWRPEVSTVHVDVSYNDFGDNGSPLDALIFEVGPPPDYELTPAPFDLYMMMRRNWWGGDTCGFPADAEWWPDTRDPYPATDPIAQAWRNGSPGSVSSCPE